MFFIAPPRPWANGYKCPGGALKKAFDGKLKYDLDEAKNICKNACKKRDDCLYADLMYTGVNNRQLCYLKGSKCGDWQSNRSQKYYIYQKGIVNRQIRILIIFVLIIKSEYFDT